MSLLKPVGLALLVGASSMTLGSACSSGDGDGDAGSYGVRVTRTRADSFRGDVGTPRSIDQLDLGPSGGVNRAVVRFAEGEQCALDLAGTDYNLARFGDADCLLQDNAPPNSVVKLSEIWLPGDGRNPTVRINWALRDANPEVTVATDKWELERR